MRTKRKTIKQRKCPSCGELRAERRAGELLRDDPELGKGKKPKLGDLGIESNRWKVTEIRGFFRETIRVEVRTPGREPPPPLGIDEQ